MKTFLNWLIKNLSNIFGLIGILLTIYFGSIYAPSWFREYQNEKVNSSQRQTIQSIKELVFSDSTVSINEIQTIVVAKELDERVTIPYNFYEILTLCQLSFMEDKFLPLAKRQDLLKKLEILKNQLPEKGFSVIQKSKSESKSILWAEIFSISLSLLAAFAGIISFYKKFKSDKEKQEEINNELENVSTDKEARHYAYEFEEKLSEALRKRSDIELTDRNYDRGIDFQFTHGDKMFYIQAKFLTRSKIGLNTIHTLTNYLREKQGEAWLIYNTDLTTLVKKEIEKFNQTNEFIKIKAIRISNEKEFEKKLSELLGNGNISELKDTN